MTDKERSTHQDPIEELLADAALEPVADDVTERLRSRLRSFQENPTELSSVHSEKENAMTTVARSDSGFGNSVGERPIVERSRNRSSSRALLFLVPGILLLSGFAAAIFFFAFQDQEKNLAGGGNKNTENTGPNIVESGKSNTEKELVDVDAKELHRQTLRDGTIVVAQAGTRYRVEARRQITLVTGDLYLIVAKSNNPFVVRTTEGEARATGTRFVVSANKGTSAAVAQGTVVLASKAGEIELNAGQQGTLVKDRRPTRQAAPRLSHVVSWAKEALAQEEKIVEVTNKENGLIAVDPWGQETRLSLRKYDVDVYIEDGIARTTIDQTFFNHNPWNGEGTFYFPLPPDASVSRLAMYVNGQLNEGGMVSREKGAQIYAEALYSNRDPALLEMMEGNMFKMRIFPLEGRQEKRVFLSYTQKLDDLYDTTKYWFPMDHSHSVAGELAIRVRVKDGATQLEPQSSTHDVKVSTDGDDLVLEYDATKTKPDQDFLLSLLRKKTDEAEVDEEEFQADSRISTCEKDGEHYLFARINPELEGAADTQPRQWIVLNDVSASRSRIDLQAQQQIMRRLIVEADDNDTVFRIDLNTEALNISNEPVSVRSDVASKIADHEPRVLIGGTNIEAGLAAVEKAIARHGMDNPYLLYLGDGVATDGEKKVSELPFKIPKGVTFVGVGVGKNIDKLFLQEAADRTGGMFANINPNEDIDWRVFDLVAALNTPRMVGIDILLFDENDKPVDAIAYPSSRGLAAGESLTVVARCEHELPASIVFRGKVNGKTVAVARDLTGAKADSQYIPRFWAKRHIDQLLKSDMPRKEEIVELSQQYYVVTPYTSLIVLENDAMYEQYGVERGRKDHWALYGAPKEIQVVKEEIDWSRWGWYGNFKGEDGKVKVSSQPKSIQEIVDSIQIRINAPFYYYQPQPRADSRTGLYHLANQTVDEKNNPTKLLTLWFLLASGERKPLTDWNRSVSEVDGDSANSDRTRGSTASRNPGARLQQLSLLEERKSNALISQLLPGFDAGGSGGGRAFNLPIQMSAGQNATRPQLVEKYRALRERDMLLSRVSDSLSRSRRGGRQQIAPSVMLSSTLGTPSFAPVSPEIGQAFQNAIAARWSRINRDVKKYNQQYSYGYWGGSWGGYGGSLDLSETQSGWGNSSGLEELMGNLSASGDGKPSDKELMLSSFLSSSDEQTSLNELIGFDSNQPMGGGLSFSASTWSSGGLFNSGSSLAAIAVLDGDMFIDGGSVSGRLMPGQGMSIAGFGGIGGGGGFGGAPLPNNLDVALQGIPMPTMMFENQSNTKTIRPVLSLHSLVKLSQSPVKSQPGMIAILAAEFLSNRREELVANIESIEDDKEKTLAKAELKAIDAAIANIDKAAVRLEDTGKFWGWNAWSWQPQSHSYNVPQVQTHQGYNWSFDLTRYAGGLYSSTLDMVDEVLEEYGSTEPLGSVEETARKRINAARDAVQTMEIQFSEDGQEILVASNDRYAATSRNEMYLEEQVICDGKNLYQIYDSLGLVARRKASDLRLSMLRRYTPHLLEPADALANHFDVSLHAEDGDSFTLKFAGVKMASPIVETESESESEQAVDDEVDVETDEDEANDESVDVHLLVKVDLTGRLLEKQVVVDGVVTFTMAFGYTDDKVVIRWIDKAGEELHKVEFLAKAVKDKDDAFDLNTDDRIVFDMPLRKPSYYLEKLQDIANDSSVGENEPGNKEQSAEPVLAEGDALEKLTYSKENYAEAIQLKRHQALALLQNFDWRRWGQQNQATLRLLTQVAAMQKQANDQISLGDVTLFGSAGHHNFVATIGNYRDVSKMPVANYFEGRHNNYVNWKKDFVDERGLLGHLASYHLASLHVHLSLEEFGDFAEQFEDSPLMLALAHNVANNKGTVDPWIKLNKQKRWSGFALLMSVNSLRTVQDRKKFTDEFWRWRDELAKDDLEPVVLPHVATIIRAHSSKDKFTEMLTSQFEKAKKSESIPVLMEFAEYVSGLSEEKIGDQAFELVRAKLNLDGDSKNEESNRQFIKRFAYAQSLWAGRRNREALDQFNLILAELNSKNVAPSPAFLGATARLAQQAGDPQRAFELEERALIAEQPYLPDMINLQAFRQRYQWLWGQYTQAIANIGSDDKDREEKLDKLLARAEESWIRWYDVDRDNAGLPGQMASLLKAAGRKDGAWKYLSTTIDRKPRDASSYYQLGVWYTNNGEADTGIDWYAQAPQWDTANPQWIFHYGMALKNAGDDDKANVEFHKIVDGKWAPGLQGWVNNAQQQLTTSQ